MAEWPWRMEPARNGCDTIVVVECGELAIDDAILDLGQVDK